MQVRRGLPLEARDLSALDPEAIARVREEARPAPRDAEELHDLLLSLVIMRSEAALEPLFVSLVAAGRAVAAETTSGSFWCALELRGAAESLLAHARFSPDLQPPAQLATRPLPGREELAARAVRGQLELCGPASAAELAR